TESTPATQAIPPTDGERLMRFVRHRDEAAFAEVVESHSTLVWSVCWQILRQRQDAEDAFQATFLILARKAHTIKANDSAAAWLYRVAFRTALRLKERRRRRREESLAQEQLGELAADEQPNYQDQLSAVAASEQTSALMEELHALPARYQRPLILHYFEAKSRAAIAEELGCTTAAVKGRLARARGMLRSRLARRGVALSAAMAVTATAFEASAATLPLALPAGTAGLALAFRTKLPLPDGAQVVGSLAHKGIAAMTVATMMKPAAGVLAVALAAVLLTQVNAKEDVSITSRGETASAAVDLLAANETKSTVHEAAEVDAPLQPSRPARRFVEIDEVAKPIPADSPPPAVELDAFDDLEVKKPGSAIVAPSQPPQSFDSSFRKPMPMPDWTVAAPTPFEPTYAAPASIKMGSAIELPAGGKKQLELERQYWALKAEGLSNQADLKENRAAAMKENATGSAFQQRELLVEATLLHAEVKLCESKVEELAGRLKQIERVEKLEKRLQENPPQPAVRRQAGDLKNYTYDATPVPRDNTMQYQAAPDALDARPAQSSRVTVGAVPQPSFGSDPFAQKASNGKIDPGETINIQAIGTLPEAPISGNYAVEPMGTVALGPMYGRVKVAGKSLLEAEELIKTHLSDYLKEPQVQVTSAKYPERSNSSWQQPAAKGLRY
ncbi:MAG: sigma-70 family RNA polymerase sigma factor, partial [Lacipirellulaceae bacterium]